MRERDAERLREVPDWKCPYLIPHTFDIVWVDEAHEIKRDDGSQSLAIQWLRPHFIGLATATPGVNRIEDWKGYLAIIRPRQAIPEDQQRAADADFLFNPYTLPKNHPLALLRLELRYAKKYIFDNTNKMQAGMYLARLQEVCTVRRTYASVVDGRVIGEDIPPIHRYFHKVQFSQEQQLRYDQATEHAKRHFIIPLKNGRLAWNRKSFREMTLLATWPGFQRIHEQIYADSLPRWKACDNLLYTWLGMIQQAEGEAGIEHSFELPNPDQTMQLIWTVCQAAPKVRALLGIVYNTVKYNRKLCIWTLMPAEQLLLWVVLRGLGIDARMYSSDLSRGQRQRMIRAFNHSEERTDAPILITSFSMSSHGLDLQHQCHETVAFDIALSRYVRLQAEYRFRRVGQTHSVTSWHLSMPNTIADRQWANMIDKAAPGIVAELTDRLFQVRESETEAGSIELGNWVMVEGRVVSAGSAEAMELAEQRGRPLPYLTAQEVINILFLTELGKEVRIELANQDEEDELQEEFQGFDD
jgi:hypothetical protein